MKKIKDIISKCLHVIIDCLMPIMPILIGEGMLKVLIILLTSVFGILSETSSTYIMLSLVAEAGFYFLPIFTAFSAGKVFNTNPYLAGVIGCMLVSPTFVDLVAQNKELTIFGLPVANTDYGTQMFASIISIWIMSYVFKFFNKVFNNTLRKIFSPALTILVMVPIAFCVIGPIGVFLNEEFCKLVLSLRLLGPIGNGIACAIIPYAIILGLSGAIVSAMITLTATGCDEIFFFANVLYNSILGLVVFALYLKDKKPNTLATAITSTVGGTSEPALFGIVMNDSKSLISLTIACFVSGTLSGILKVKAFAMASMGLFGLAATIGPGSSIFSAVICVIVGCVIGFVLNLILHKKIS